MFQSERSSWVSLWALVLFGLLQSPPFPVTLTWELPPSSSLTLQVRRCVRVCLYVHACADICAHTDAYMMHSHIGGSQRTTCRSWFLPSPWVAGTALGSQGLAEAYHCLLSRGFTTSPSHLPVLQFPFSLQLWFSSLGSVFLPSLCSWETSHFAASRLAKCCFPVPSSLTGLPVTGVCAPGLPVAFRAPSCFSLLVCGRMECGRDIT